MQVPGKSIYLKICLDEEERKSEKELAENIEKGFQEAFESFFAPHQKEIESMQVEFTSQADEAKKPMQTFKKILMIV